MSEKWDAMEFDSSWRLHSRQRIFFMLNPPWDWTDEKTELGGLKAHCESPKGSLSITGHVHWVVPEPS
jgi:hypothetical protein